MAPHPIIWVLTSPCMLIYMGMIQGALRIWIYIDHGESRRFIKDAFLYKGSSSWNKLPPWAKEYTSLNGFKHNFRLLNGWIHPEVTIIFICTPISHPILMHQFNLQLVRYIHIRNLSQSYHDVVVFMYDLYLWMCMYVCLCSLYLCILLGNRAPPWKDSVIEWFSLYKNIFDIKYPPPPPPPPPPRNHG